MPQVVELSCVATASTLHDAFHLQGLLYASKKRVEEDVDPSGESQPLFEDQGHLSTA